jgi:hypothetical protein
MKTFLFALPFLLLPLLVVAQPAKTQKKRSADFWEEFDVCADNDTIRDGGCTRRVSSGTRLCWKKGSMKTTGAWAYGRSMAPASSLS